MGILSASALIILFFASVGGAFVQRVSGFGFGIFAMTILPHVMPSYGEATALSSMMASVTSAIIVVKMYRFLNWKKLIPILITFLVVSYFSILFVASVSDGMLKKVLGAILILVSIYFFFFSDKLRLKPTLLVQISMGVISGVMGGLFSMQGPPAVLYFLACTERKEEYMVLAQTYFVLGNAMMTVFRWQNGFVTESVLVAWCCGLVAVLIGTWLGTLVFRQISAQLLKKIIYAYMAVSGVVAML